MYKHTIVNILYINEIVFSLFFATVQCFGSTLYFKDGKSLSATILEANETHVKIARERDLQQFRFPIELLTIDSQQQIELYHSKGRYSNIPTVDRPIAEKTLGLCQLYR